MYKKDEIILNLKMADEYFEEEFGNVEPITLTIVGGAAMILQGCKRKTTFDVDVIEEMSDRLQDYLLSFAVNNQAKDVVVFPKGFHDRLKKVKMRENGIFTFSIPSKEDIVLMKINRFDANDIRDFKVTGIVDQVNLTTLIELGEELSSRCVSYKTNWEMFRETFYV